MTDLFEEKARDWDEKDRVRGLSAGIGEAIRSNIRLDVSMLAMDFGAGTGLITAQIGDKVGKVVAVDVSQAMLDKLIEKESLLGKVEAVCQDILSQPLGRRFDLIVSAMAMHHIENTDQLIACFTRHLKPGGTIALADLDEEDGSFHSADAKGVYHKGFNREALRFLLLRHDFKDIRFVTAYRLIKNGKPYPVFLVLASRT